MCRYVVITLLMMMVRIEGGPSPLRVRIDCNSEEKETFGRSRLRTKYSRTDPTEDFHVDTFCDFIQSAIPEAVKDGRFVLLQPDMDQVGFSDTVKPISVSPPEGFIPKYTRFKTPKLKVSKLSVPKLRAQADSPRSAPSVGASKFFNIFRSTDDMTESSAERMEKFKKGVQKLLHVVKVIGQIDQYLSERTRILIDKLSKTFAD